MDAEFLDFHVNKSTVGFYFHIGKKLLDVLVLSDQSKLKIPIKKNANEKLVLLAKNLGEDEEKHGSVTILLENYFGVSSEIQLGQRYKQWITFFDHPDDDIYDGILNDDDEEVPRIYLEFLVEEVDTSKSVRSSDIGSSTKTTSRPATSQGKVGENTTTSTSLT